MPTIEAPPRTIADVESELAAAKAELVEAESAAAAAWTKVDESKADHAVGRLVKAILLGHQRELASAQSRVGDLQWRIKGLERLGTELRAAADADKARVAAERGNALRAAGALLAGQYHTVLARFLDDVEELEREARAFNGQANMPVHYRLRPIGDYPLLRDRMVDSVQRLLSVFPPTPTAKSQHEGQS